MSLFQFAPEQNICGTCGTRFTDPKREKCPHTDPDYRVPDWYTPGWSPVAVGGEAEAPVVTEE